MEKFKIIGKEVMKRLATLREDCTIFLKTTLKEFDGDITLVNSDGEFIDSDVVSCTYDGGDNPEYAANPYSQVYSVFFNEEDNKIYLETEDCDEYCIDRVDSVMEVYYVCSLVQSIIG